MQESLYDRFRPFKPYDQVLAVVVLVLVAAHSDTTVTLRAVMVAVGVGLFGALELTQRVVRVPTPLWQSLSIVCANTVVLTFLDYLVNSPHFTLPFFMLNVAFATLAFGQQVGAAAAVLSIFALAHADTVSGAGLRPFTEWGLFLTVLLAMVALLVRVNRLQEDALFDVVTGLRNHRYFQVRLREEVMRSDRNGKPTSLVVIDLDNFKRVNDRFGHAVGDYVLRQVSHVLQSNARAADIVCRYGGEEITIILPETGMPEASLVAERLRQAVEKRNDRPGPAVTISLGVASYPDHADQTDSLIIAADTAMYEAKRAGKNRVMLAAPRSAMQSLEN